MPLAKLGPQPRIADQVYDAIHSAIMSGAYLGGQRLRIRDLAAELGTSVMPVREAIRRLEEAGLVETLPNRGARVKEFTPTVLLDVYAVRRLLEPEASELGAASATDADIEQLTEACSAMRRHLSSGNVVAYLDADEHFLTTLYAASGNPVLVEAIELLWQRCRAYKIVGARSELEAGEPTALLEFQTELLRAAINHDASAARRLATASIDAAIDRIHQALLDH